MHLSLLSAALAALQITSTFAHVAQDIEERDLEQRATPRVRKCGSTDPPEEIVESARQFASAVAANEISVEAAAAHAPIVINTYFHVVTSSSKQGRYTQTQLNNQVCPVSLFPLPFIPFPPQSQPQSLQTINPL